MPFPLSPHLKFSQAAEQWLEAHTRHISEETVLDYKKCIRVLLLFFATMTLGDIDPGNIRAYQEERGEKQRVNKECVVLKMILHDAGLWEEKIKPWYRPVQFRKKEIGRRLTWDEEDRLKKVVQTAVEEDRKQWALAGNCLLIMANTSFGFKELKYLRRRDVYLEDRIIILEVQAKNDGRYRRVPLNQTAFDAMAWLCDRWERIGGTDPEGFILPHRAHIKGASWDFYTPMGSIKNAHAKIMTAAKIKNFRIYDCRHHAISKWLANPKVSFQTAEEMAGHIGRAMQRRYSHQLIEQMRLAVDAMEAPPKREPVNISENQPKVLKAHA
jgi:integrase